MPLLPAKSLFCILLSGFFSCMQNAKPQSEGNQSQLKESNRIFPAEFDLPLHLTPNLSGNFGELRNNHFHSGLDFKTLKGVGYPVYAVADGWVSRIRVSNYGFGYALYIDHPNGFTTVYAHLQKYAPPIDLFTQKAQYANEQFELDTLLKPGVLPVKRGQIIAFSGNSGISAAPHLHFEIRDTKTEETIDPMLWYSHRIKDNLPPRFQKIALYTIEDQGALSTGNTRSFVSVNKNQQGEWVLNGELPTAWGKVGVGLNAYDYMNENSNMYGVSSVRLYLEDAEIFRQEMSRFAFNQTRYVNSLTDYELWQKSRSWIMRSFLEPENKLNIYLDVKNSGYIDIREEKTYHLRYVLMDRAGNVSEIRFDIQGKKQEIPVTPKSKNYFECWKTNHFMTTDAEVTIPAGYLYQNIDFQFKQVPGPSNSDLYTLHCPWIPLHQPIPVSFRIQKDEVPDKRAYYLAKRNRYGSFQYVGGHYANGMMQARISEFGDYTVMTDTVPPKIVGINLENAVKNRLFRIRISDNASGIAKWRGTIDGAWVLFEFDGKSSQLKYLFDDSRLIKGKSHQLVLTVEDACGNQSRIEKTFYY